MMSLLSHNSENPQAYPCKQAVMCQNWASSGSIAPEPAHTKKPNSYQNDDLSFWCKSKRQLGFFHMYQKEESFNNKIRDEISVCTFHIASISRLDPSKAQTKM